MRINRFYITTFEISKLRNISDSMARRIYRQHLKSLGKIKTQGITYVEFSELEGLPLELLYFALNLDMTLVNWNAYYAWKDRQQQMQTKANGHTKPTTMKKVNSK